MQSINEVIDRLDEITALCARERTRAGYFAALYRHMTLQVKLGMESGLFEDNARMEHLDIRFAQRYFDAFDAYQAGRTPTRAWAAAFAATGSRSLTIVQQLLLGINAHINLDLGIASAATCPGASLPGLQRDFGEINNIIGALMDQVKAEIGEVSPWFSLLDHLAGRSDDAIVNFSIDVARDEAWKLAEAVAPLSPPDQAPVIDRRDAEVAWFAGLIKRPGVILGLATRLIAAREDQDERQVIAALTDRLKPAAVMARAAERKTAAAAQRA